MADATSHLQLLDHMTSFQLNTFENKASLINEAGMHCPDIQPIYAGRAVLALKI